MRRYTVMVLLGFCAALLGGCLSIPISTIWKVSRMSDDDLFNMDPAQLRAVVDLPANVPVDPSKIVIGFCFLKSKNDTVGVGGNWPVQLMNKGQYVAAALPTVAPDRMLYQFRLSDEAQANLNGILAARRADKNAFTDVAVNIKIDAAGDPPPGVTSYRTSSWFQLSQQQGYLQLFDNYKVDDDDIRKDLAKNAPPRSEPPPKYSGCT
jgi:hypothetical protein